ncbi:magnesium chelatase subunit D [Sphingomonas hengshuiensis]|uniref:Magnesium chelatase n=1 Tax=Sphingomonas hengshuiensis TaxID=1609977 RepID=A0A7U5CUV1_9SPHN|nr:magnesium chelatase subunit D [Sphingomonas hengshuiensis]AJP74029.1 magnesium chelatase [Sphingomonas hengshuiensis]
MTGAGEDAPDGFPDALLAARLCAIDPGLGGMILRGGGELRDAVIAELRAGLPEGAPVRRIPAHIDDERLLGGLDLTLTLARGAPVSRVGVLAEADGGVVIVPMAERLSDANAGRIAGVIDAGEVVAERDGMAMRSEARFVVVALDEGVEPDERAPVALMERVAFWIELTRSSHPHPSGASRLPPSPNGRGKGPAAAGGGKGEGDALGGTVPRAPPAAHPSPYAGEDILSALVATAATLGIDSARAPLFALRAARASARLARRETITEEDAVLAARLVLAPRATRLPMPEEAPQPEAPPPPPPEGNQGEEEHAPGPIEDVVLAAALAALPKDVLARIAAGGNRRAAPIRAQGAGERRKSPARGRPMGTRAGVPGGGRRLSLIDTLRAAAPWQSVRGREGRILVRRDDLRIRRFESRAEALTIFAVDASGSSALARLAEAKGAVELLLAEAYVKRAQVALVAFRGVSHELLLPPTRSLARARRSLAELPGGGGTPLAAGLNAARELAEAARARGRTPFIVVLTDGRANIAADGSAVRATAEADAEAAARAIGAAGIAAAFVDISARPRPEGAALAAAMRARYLPLPRADAAAMHAAVRAAQRP